MQQAVNEIRLLYYIFIKYLIRVQLFRNLQ